MSSNENLKAKEEELKQLEEQAYFELCQIIAEALQLQDIKVLNSRLASWKIKYKKLLDGSTPNSTLIQKIKHLQSDNYIGYIIDMIMQRIAIKEHIKINNQLKAVRKLYAIIKETNDLKTLKSKVEEWKRKYPVNSFLEMYQKKIAYYTSNKNLEDNALDQEKAFADLIEITKKNGTFDELKGELAKWEDKYSIHDKYELDDFINHKSDIKRYTSDEYIKSIAKSETPSENNNDEKLNTYEQYSDLTKQAHAYAALVAITKQPNNLDKVFNWVRKYSSINFNENYKELILAATYLDYSPKYLSSLKTPNINILDHSLSIDEFKNIDNIKRYAIISYFNLLLPKEQSIQNNYFNNYVEDIYYKSKNIKAKTVVSVPESENISSKGEAKPIETSAEIEIEKATEPDIISTEIEQESSIKPEQIESTEVEVNYVPETKVDHTETKIENTTEPDIISTEIEQESSTKPEPVKSTEVEAEYIPETISTHSETKIEKATEPEVISIETETEIKTETKTKSETEIETTSEPIITHSEIKLEEPSDNSDSLDISLEIEKILDNPDTSYEIEINKDTANSITYSQLENEDIENDYIDNETVFEEQSNEENTENTEEFDVLTYSPMFFDTVYDYTVQADLIQTLDKSAEEYVERVHSGKSIDLEKNNIEN